jgi:hypothetical protein
MVTQQSLKDKFEEKASRIEASIEGVSDEKAAKRPSEGEWSMRDVLCHLSGDASGGFHDDLHRFLNEEVPEFGLTPGELYWTPEREKQSLSELGKSTAAQYRKIGEFVATLTPQQLDRVGRIGFLKEFRGSDEIKLGEWITVISELHLNQHLDQLEALRK